MPDVSTKRYVCPVCQYARPWTDGRTVEGGDDFDEYWCQVCGAETPLADCEVQPAFSCGRCGDDSEPAMCQDRHSFDDHGICCVGRCGICQTDMTDDYQGETE